MGQQNNSELLNLMGEDSTTEITSTEIPKTQKIAELSVLVNTMTQYEKEMAVLIEKLEEKKKKFDELNNVRIPDLFSELGIKKITLSDGRVVEIKLKYAASITPENAEDCFTWLKENGHEGIIKHEVKVNIKKGENEERSKIIMILNDLGVSYTDKDLVHPQTLASFVKEQVENGSDFPTELFRVFPVRSTKIK